MSNEIQMLEAETNSTLADARAFEVKNDEQLGEAVECLRGIKGLQKKVDAAFDPIIKAAHEAHKTAVGQKKASMAPLEAAESLLKQKSLAYTQDRDARLKADREAAEKKAREEAEAARAAEAKQLWTEGKRKEAAAVKAAPLVIAPPAPVAEPVRMKGQSVRTDYDFEIVDQSQIKPEFMVPNEVLIRKQVRMLGQPAETLVGGIRVIEKQVMAVLS